MSEGFTLITGRTPEQGKALHQGKGSEVYRRATALVEMSPEDMARFERAYTVAFENYPVQDEYLPHNEVVACI